MIRLEISGASTWPRIAALTLVLAVVVSVTGCARQEVSSRTGEVMLRFPGGGGVAGIAWPQSDSIYVLLLEGDEGPIELVEVEGSRIVRRFPSETLVGCSHPWLLDLSRLPDGRAGVVGDCGPKSPRIALRISGTRIEEIAQFPAKTLVAWNPGMEDGWIEYLYNGCQSIARFVDGEALPFPPYYPKNLIPWDVDRDFFARGDCVEPGRAGFITPSNSGVLYFLASKEGVGVLSSDVEWDLLSFSPSTGKLRQIAKGFRRPTDLDITPNGKALLVSADRNGVGGIWQINPSREKVHLLAASDLFGVVSPSPDSRYVAVAHTVVDKGDELVRLQLKGM